MGSDPLQTVTSEGDPRLLATLWVFAVVAVAGAARILWWYWPGSVFDGVPVDCKRDESGSSFLNKVDHRLEAFDAELGTPGATYYYEGMYMVPGDVDKTNNIASRNTSACTRRRFCRQSRVFDSSVARACSFAAIDDR